MGALGFYNSGNKYSYKGATPLTDAVLGIRYVIESKETTADHLVLESRTEHKYIYENRYCLSIGFMVDRLMENWNIIEGDPFVILNDLARISTDTELPVFTGISVPDPETEEVRITTQTEDTWYYNKESGASSPQIIHNLSCDEDAGDVYGYFEASHCDSMEVKIDGQSRSYVDEKGHIVHLGKLGPENEVQLIFPVKTGFSSGNVRVQLAAYQPEVFETVYNILSEHQLDVTRADDTHIEGRISLEEPGLMMLSVPYDQGWKVTVDGKGAETLVIGDALTGLYLESGDHEIRMVYEPQGFKAGLAISLLSLFIYILTCIRQKRLKKS